MEKELAVGLANLLLENEHNPLFKKLLDAVRAEIDLKLSCEHVYTTMMDGNYCIKCHSPDPDNKRSPIK